MCGDVHVGVAYHVCLIATTIYIPDSSQLFGIIISRTVIISIYQMGKFAWHLVNVHYRVSHHYSRCSQTATIHFTDSGEGLDI